VERIHECRSGENFGYHELRVLAVLCWQWTAARSPTRQRSEEVRGPPMRAAASAATAAAAAAAHRRSTRVCEERQQGEFLRRRPVEIEHGRFSLYACIGYFVREYSELGGYLSPSIGLRFSDRPNGLVAFSKATIWFAGRHGSFHDRGFQGGGHADRRKFSSKTLRVLQFPFAP